MNDTSITVAEAYAHARAACRVSESIAFELAAARAEVAALRERVEAAHRDLDADGAPEWCLDTLRALIPPGVDRD